MYLLKEAQGHGIGGQLMGEFFLWADGAPLHLWVTEYNGRAIRFYERHGFQLTGERELWRGRLPNVRMARGAVSCSILGSHETRAMRNVIDHKTLSQNR